jgi:hypothetical protein
MSIFKGNAYELYIKCYAQKSKVMYSLICFQHRTHNNVITCIFDMFRPMLKMNVLLGFVIFVMGSGQIYFWSYINVSIPSIY